MKHRGARIMVAAAALTFLMGGAAMAQQTTTTTETKAFTVVGVDGNTLVVKLPEGTKEITVADDFKFTVDGQQLSVRDLKPGMKGTATITTKTTQVPVVVTEVKNGTVFDASAGSIILQTDQGFKSFTAGELDKRGVKLFKDGQPVQLSDFHKGDKLTATIVTTKPPKTMTEKQVNATLAQAGSPETKAPGMATRTSSTAGTAPTASSGKKLPKTASSLPATGLLGLALLGIGAALSLRRRSAR